MAKEKKRNEAIKKDRNEKWKKKKKKSGKSCDSKKLMNKTIIFGNKKFTIDSLFTNEKWVKPKHKKTSVIRRRVMFSLDKKSSE